MLSAMAKRRTRLADLPWRAGICLLLGVFFLYNPFVTICMSSELSATFHHPVSYRSTIASSELGCGTIEQAKVHVAPVQVLLPPGRVPLQQEDDIRPRPTEEIVRVVPQDFVSSLWFRPPPTL